MTAQEFLKIWDTLPASTASQALAARFLPAFENIPLERTALEGLELHLESLPEDRQHALLESLGGWRNAAAQILGEESPIPSLLTEDLALDFLLGLKMSQTEAKVPSSVGRSRGAAVESALGDASWSGSGTLSRSSLNTPYRELFELLEKLNLQPDAHVVDLGAGYGRMGFVLAFCLPEVRFTGYEIVSQRVQESQRVAKLHEVDPERVRFECRDLADPDFAPDDADLYFLYDPFNRDTLVKVMRDLQAVTRRRTIRIASRGKTGELQDYLAQTHWLRREGWIQTRHAPIWIHRSV